MKTGDVFTGCYSEDHESQESLETQRSHTGGEMTSANAVASARRVCVVPDADKSTVMSGMRDGCQNTSEENCDALTHHI